MHGKLEPNTYRDESQPPDPLEAPAPRGRQLPGGYTLGTYFVLEIVCTMALVTLVLVGLL